MCLSGNIQLMFESVSSALPPCHGRIAAAARRQFDASDCPNLPDVPTIAESGYPDYFVSVWYGVAAAGQAAG